MALGKRPVEPDFYEADFFTGLSPSQIIVLSITGGCFVTLGGLFSVLLAMGVETPGVQLLLQGLGFSTGFFMIILSRALLAKHPGATIIGEVKCSQTMYDDIEAHGGRGVLWKTGHSLIETISKMRRVA